MTEDVSRIQIQTLAFSARTRALTRLELTFVSHSWHRVPCRILEFESTTCLPSSPTGHPRLRRFTSTARGGMVPGRSNTEVIGATKSIEEIAGGRNIDVLIANAGGAPAKYSLSAQGHELGFAVNVLGHHVFVRRLAQSGAFARGRLVVLSAQIYPTATDCTSDFRFKGRVGSYMGYCRSKLGNLWFAREFAERYSDIEVYSMHPGVIASNILAGEAPILSGLTRALLIDVVAGAQTPLFVATQPGLQRGGYYHNKLGLVRMRPMDISLDARKSSALWSRLEELAAAFL